MNGRGVPFGAPRERSEVCFGGFRPTKHVKEAWALATGAPLSSVTFLGHFPSYRVETYRKKYLNLTGLS